MSELRRSLPKTGAANDPIVIAVRPSRLQIASARLSLLFHGREGRVPIGLATFAIGVGLGMAGTQFLRFVLAYGLLDALGLCAGGIVGLALVSMAGVGALLLHASRGAEPLSRIEMESGVLLQLGPGGLAATIRGATTYHDWEHVAVQRTAGGIAFLLPRRTFYLLPCSELRADQELRLRGFLAGAASGRQALADAQLDVAGTEKRPI